MNYLNVNFNMLTVIIKYRNTSGQKNLKRVEMIELHCEQDATIEDDYIKRNKLNYSN